MKALLQNLGRGALGLLLSTLCLHAGDFTVLRSFGILTNVTGLYPYAPLIQGPDGTLYGITSEGEGNISAVAFRINPDGTGFQALQYFSAVYGQTSPYGGLLLVSNLLYGTTSIGSTNSDGVIFAVSTNGSYFTNLYNLGTSTNDGYEPWGNLIFSGGFLYGTTQYGGSGEEGSVFKISTNGAGMTNLVNFNYTNGAEPRAGLVLSGGTLYGVTTEGGSNGNGTLFKVNTDGSGFATMHNFGSQTNDGDYPAGTLLLSENTLYGATEYGGTNNWGAVFSITTGGSAYTNLFSFAAAAYNSNNVITNSNGAGPDGALVLNGSFLYGTTYQGGTNGKGTIFQLSTNGGSFSDIYTFKTVSGTSAGLVFSNSTLYGTAFYGGSYSYGALFSLTTNGGNFTNFLSFAVSDAGYPKGQLVLSNGTLFGAAGGGSYGEGAIFRINTNGLAYTNLCNFSMSSNAIGPSGNLALLGNTLYGTTSTGINNADGVLFRINTDGSGYTNLVVSPGGGELPEGGLVYDNGLLYGQSPDGGSEAQGCIFTSTTNGVDNPNFFDFWGTGYNYPAPALLPSGNTLYGVIESDEDEGSGAVFSIGVSGSPFNVIYGFSAQNPDTGTNTDGTQPSGSLIQYSNTLFGTTQYGGFYGFGTIYRVDINGSNFMNLHNFTGYADGAEPTSSLVLSSNTLYGTAGYGGGIYGVGGNGTVFSLSTNGTGFAVLHSFTGGTDGANPLASLILSGNTLYGTASVGGNLDEGVVFSLVPEPLLALELSGHNVILTWSDPAYSLQSAPTANGTFTTLGSATSPYTNAISGTQQYFRLISN